MKMIKTEIKRLNIHASKSVEIEEFESVEEAIHFLGEEKSLRYLNYAHRLTVQSMTYKELTRKTR